ncbi:kinase protein [Salix suchowensis]|nr:kinase protein [Salix suchowensis]
MDSSWTESCILDVTKPFLALHLRDTDPNYYRVPNLFVVTQEKPRLPWSEYFVLNSRSEADGRTLKVVPPLPFKDPLYLSVTPRICARFDNDDERSIKLLQNIDYQLDEAGFEMFLRAWNGAGPSVPVIGTTGGDDEPGSRWDTWSGQSPKEAPGILFVDRDVQFHFEALPLQQLPENSKPLIRRATISTPTLPVVHDGDPVVAAENEDGEWDNEPQLKLDMARATPAVYPKISKSFYLTRIFSSYDRDGPLQNALAHIFPPSQYSRTAKELLDLYVEYESVGTVEQQIVPAVDVVRGIARYLGASVDDSTINNAMESYGKVTRWPGGQQLIAELIDHGYVPVAIPSAPKETVTQYEGLSLGLYSDCVGDETQSQMSSELWRRTLSFCKQFDPDIRLDQILVFSWTVALKFEVIDPLVPSTIPYEAAVYAQLEGVEGIPHIRWSGQDKNANAMVMDKLGLNLEQLRRFCRGQLGLKTILMLGEQMLSTIEHVHARGIIVRDIKPDNFAMGYLEDYQRLYLFDMGLSKLYLDPTVGKHMPFREGRGGIGTPRYASHNVHFGLGMPCRHSRLCRPLTLFLEPSRRDDVEAIGILLLYLLHGRLPWQGICAPDIPAKLRRIGEMKRGVRFTELLAHSPAFFTPFFSHCRALKFDEKPDYTLLKTLLRGQ